MADYYIDFFTFEKKRFSFTVQVRYIGILLYVSCAMALLQKGAKVDDAVVSIQHTVTDWRKFYKLSTDQKLPVWEWLPTQVTKEEVGPEEQTFSVYEVYYQRSFLNNSVIQVY